MTSLEDYFRQTIILPDAEPARDRVLSEAERSFMDKFLGAGGVLAAASTPTASGPAILDSAIPDAAEPVLGPVAEPVAEPVAGPVEPQVASPQAVLPKVRASQRQESAQDAQDGQDGQGALVELVSFTVGAQAYCLPIQDIQEVIKTRVQARLPMSPPWLLGIIDLRGMVTPIVSMASLLFLEEPEFGAERLVVVCRRGEIQIGLAVASMATMHRARQSDVEWGIESRLGVPAGLLSGLLKDKGRIYGIMSVDRVVEQVLSTGPDGS